MKIKITDDFLQKLSDQIEYIAKDKPQAARKFKSEVISKIRKLARFPSASRKSIYFEDEHIRDLIVIGHKIVYRIKPGETEVEVFGFIRSQEGL